MGLKRVIRTASLVWVFTAGSWTLAADEGELQVVELGSGVFAVLQPAQDRFNQSNSLFMIRENGVLVVDTQSTDRATLEVIAEIRQRTDLPVREIVLTHWHGDHVQGVATYRKIWPEVEVIGHASLDADILERAQPQLEEEIDLYETAIADARERLATRVDREGAPLDESGVQDLAGRIERAEAHLDGMLGLPRPFELPSLRYERELGLGRGPGKVRLLHRKAHSRGDTLVYLPQLGVLFSGDVVDDLPFGGHGYPAKWLETLEELMALEIKTIVPGHGRVRTGKEHLSLLREMFAAIVEGTQKAVADGLDVEATRTQVLSSLEGFHRALTADDEVASRAWETFVPATIDRAWAEARGEVVD